MPEVLNSFSLTGLAASLARAMNVECPKEANPSLVQLDELVRSNTKTGYVDRIFMYNPDAIAMWLYQKYTEKFSDVVKHTQLALPLRAVMPSVTPVCFGTMYTGAYPEVHGIRSYTKPVIRIDTLFDAALRAGKKVALVVDNECSLGKIFCERNMDYYYYDSIEEINEKALKLIEEDRHDLICVYNTNYDYAMHRCGTESAESMNELEDNVRSFDVFAQTVKRHWKNHDVLIGFAMDHGCHDIDGGCGSHGLDMPEDLNIVHFYGVYPKAE